MDTVRESGEKLLAEYPGLEIRGFVGDFESSLGRLLAHRSDRGRLVAILGGTIGNFTPRKRRGFLDGIRAGLREGDHLLVGMATTPRASPPGSTKTCSAS